MANKKDIVPVISEAKDQKLSKLQKQFNYRTKRIKSLKKKIDTLRQVNDTYFQRYSREIIPLEDKMIDHRISFVKMLDQHYPDKYFRTAEKLAIKEIIETQSFNLAHDFGVEEMIAIHDKYAEVSYAEEMEEAKEMEEAFTKSFIENMFDVEIDEVGDLNDEDNFQKIQEEVQKKMEEREQAYKEERKQRKKTKKQQEKEEAKEQKLKEEAKNLSKTSRAIYMELVKELHPDKEPDEAEKARKTEIMTRVTQAYEKNDFFELLKLQIEYKEGSAQVQQLQDNQLKYYNKLLQDQIRELQGEEYMLSHPAPPLDEVFFNMNASKITLKDQFNLGVLKTEMELREIEKDGKYVEKKGNLRKFLREYIEQQNEMDEEEGGFDDLMDSLFF